MEKLQQMADMLEFSYSDTFGICKFTKNEEKFAKENGIAVAFVLDEGWGSPYDVEVKVIAEDNFHFQNIFFDLYNRNSSTEDLQDWLILQDTNVKLTVSKGTIPTFFEGQTDREGLILSASVPYVKFPLAFSRKDERMTEGIIFYLNKKPEMQKNINNNNIKNNPDDYLCKESR